MALDEKQVETLADLPELPPLLTRFDDFVHGEGWCFDGLRSEGWHLLRFINSAGKAIDLQGPLWLTLWLADRGVAAELQSESCRANLDIVTWQDSSNRFDLLAIDICPVEGAHVANLKALIRSKKELAVATAHRWMIQRNAAGGIPTHGRWELKFGAFQVAERY